MYLINRKGEKERLSHDLITLRNIDIAKGENFPYGKLEHLNINTTSLSNLVIESLKNGMTTSEIDELSAETSFYMSTYDPDYDILASRIKISNLHKSTPESFLNSIQILKTEKILTQNIFMIL